MQGVENEERKKDAPKARKHEGIHEEERKNDRIIRIFMRKLAFSLLFLCESLRAFVVNPPFLCGLLRGGRMVHPIALPDPCPPDPELINPRFRPNVCP
jgi:hypothetical protein